MIDIGQFNEFCKSFVDFIRFLFQVIFIFFAPSERILKGTPFNYKLSKTKGWLSLNVFYRLLLNNLRKSLNADFSR